MNIWQKLTDKPWLAQPEGMDPALLQSPEPYWPERIALRFFLVTASVVFSLFVMTLLGRSQLPDFHALAGEPWLPLSEPRQLWWNSAILLLSSISMHLGLVFARRSRLHQAMLATACSLLLMLLFLLAQYLVWQQLAFAGFGFTSNPASNYFYLLTAVHGVHLLGGIVAACWVLWYFWQQQAASHIISKLSLSVTYSHFMLVVWLLLFALLTSPASTIDTLAALCGFSGGRYD
ncbi:hypothetical protein WG68_01430 [Arsukibacterium ikkense]|uniref:Heme-copper oxidase subunit III family profile domain-containing protein n=1 Tax=Arsukibacterium ikkense TaxID=336831 RepID=A0A0M2VA54_9GAMM|nr:cytochrome c oxidase subunit 3 [Arsukibacterium ikkense]KKO47324.1 hypothetical protein WG68_01430 [Arsukibacterium ikkense]